jgi:hypothetical protein
VDLPGQSEHQRQQEPKHHHQSFLSFALLAFSVFMGHGASKDLRIPLRTTGWFLLTLLNLTGFFFTTVYGGLFISKMMSKAKVSSIESFEDLLGKSNLHLLINIFPGTNHKIILRKGHFVENFFATSEAETTVGLRGRVEPREWRETDTAYGHQMRRLVEDVLTR